jgi:PAS domain S-box-containing protein
MNENEQANRPVEPHTDDPVKPGEPVINFSQIYAYAPVAIYTCDRDGYVTSFNEAAALLWGREPEIGKDLYGCWNIYYPDGRPMPLAECPMARALKEGIAVDNELITIENPGHNFKTLQVFSTPLFDALNQLTGSHNTLIDVTGRELDETRNATLSAIVESSDDAIISKKLDGTITSWNAGAERIFGYTEQEILGKSVTILIPPAKTGEEDLILGNVRNGRRVDHFETVRLHKDGWQIPISLTVSPIKDGQGNIIGASKVARDISERNIAETKQAMLAAIVASSDDAIISKDLNGMITSWNGGAERIFGYTEAEITGRSITLLIPPSRMDEEQQIIGRIKNGERTEHFETIRLSKNGREIPISLTVSPIKDSKGNVIGASKVARDITEQLASKAMLAKLFEEVKALSEKKDEFIALASHELKTPLTSIKGYLQILGRNELEQTSRRFLDKSLNQVEKLHLLVEDMLSLSKIEAGKLEFSSDIFDIKALLLDIIETFGYSNTTHTIIHELHHGDPVIIEADKHRIEQVIINLMNNAIKYSPDADKVEVTLKFDPETVIIGIKDEGMGLTAAQQNEIFSRFYRAEGTKGISGLGLGLYLTKQIIDRHHGGIQVQSEPGKGSVFSVSLPRKSRVISPTI